MRLKIPVFWQFQLAGWIAFTVFTLPVKMAVAGSFPGALGSFAVRDGFSFLLTLAMRAIYGRIYRNHKHLAWIVGSITLVSLAAGLLQLPVFYLVGDIFPFEEKTIFGQSVALGNVYYRTGLFTFWSLLYFGIRFDREKRDREAQLVETELRALRAIINSHFLFNALNIILMALQRQSRTVQEMVQALADYLNYSLRHKDDDLVSLGEEADALMDYLVLEKARFGTNLDIACQIDETARDLRVPGVILQPLVENAIKYGCETWTPPIVVRLVVTREVQELLIEIANTGHWVKPDPNRKSGGVGLDNIQKRLGLLYSGHHTMEIVPEAGWVSVRIRIPAKL